MLWHRGKAYSQDLRERVFTSADDGKSVGRFAERLRVSVSYVSKVRSRRYRTGQTTARAQRCHLPLRLADLHGAIEAQAPSVRMQRLRNYASGWTKPTRSRRAPG